MNQLFLKISSKLNPSFFFVFFYWNYLFFLSTLVNEDSDSDTNEAKAPHDSYGPRTRHELVIDDLPPIENLTITLSEETPIERIVTDANTKDLFPNIMK